MIEAKPVIPDQYWILRQDNRKIGNIETGSNGVEITVNGQKRKFATLNELRKSIKVDFQDIEVMPTPHMTNQVNGFPTTSEPHNSVFNVKYQLPLWTRDPHSRSWMAAGWYRVRQHRDWQIVLCPKLILLERYEYQGPFRTQAEARI